MSVSVIYKPLSVVWYELMHPGSGLIFPRLIANIYTTCSHGCTYCCIPRQHHVSQDQFFGPAQAKPGVIETLREEAAALGPQDMLSLSNAGDAYPSRFASPEDDVTREAIDAIKNSSKRGRPLLQVLTKGGTRACRDYDLLDQRDRIGQTLTFIEPKDSLKYEPGGALPEDRLDALREAKRRGGSTWASVEPVIDPAQTLELLRASASFVDYFWIGRQTGASAVELDWPRFQRDVRDVLHGTRAEWGFKK
jgi:DNA repair photolyase